jgi:Rieske Fe-S protein
VKRAAVKIEKAIGTKDTPYRVPKAAFQYLVINENINAVFSKFKNVIIVVTTCTVYSSDYQLVHIVT